MLTSNEKGIPDKYISNITNNTNNKQIRFLKNSIDKYFNYNFKIFLNNKNNSGQEISSTNERFVKKRNLFELNFYDVINLNDFEINIRVHIPIYYLTNEYNKNISSYSLILYNKYPLLSPYNKNFSEKVISLRMFDSNFNKIEIVNLTKPIEIFIKKPYKEFNNCIFFDPNQSFWGVTGCNSIDLGDTVMCSCHHLTDFSLSNYNPQLILRDMVYLISDAWIINDFETFKNLSLNNAQVIFIYLIITIIYIFGLVFTTKYDKKDPNDNYIYEVNRISYCCSKKETIENINELKEVTLKAEEERKIKALKFLEHRLNNLNFDKKVLSCFGINLQLETNENINRNNTIDDIDDECKEQRGKSFVDKFRSRFLMKSESVKVNSEQEKSYVKNENNEIDIIKPAINSQKKSILKKVGTKKEKSFLKIDENVTINQDINYNKKSLLNIFSLNNKKSINVKEIEMQIIQAPGTNMQGLSDNENLDEEDEWISDEEYDQVFTEDYFYDESIDNIKSENKIKKDQYINKLSIKNNQSKKKSTIKKSSVFTKTLSNLKQSKLNNTNHFTSIDNDCKKDKQNSSSENNIQDKNNCLKDDKRAYENVKEINMKQNENIKEKNITKIQPEKNKENITNINNKENQINNSDEKSNKFNKSFFSKILFEGLKVNIQNKIINSDEFILKMYKQSENNEIKKDISRVFVIKESKKKNKKINPQSAKIDEKKKEISKNVLNNSNDLSRNILNTFSKNDERSINELNDKQKRIDSDCLCIAESDTTGNSNLITKENSEIENFDNDIEIHREDGNEVDEEFSMPKIELRYKFMFQYLSLLKHFFVNEYRLICIFISQFNTFTKTTFLSLLCFRLYIALGVSAILSPTMETENKSSNVIFIF